MRTPNLEAQLAVLRAEYRALHEALSAVMREDDRHHPCDHPHDAANGCTHCHARDLAERFPPDYDAAPLALVGALYEVRSGLYALRVLDQRGQGARALTPTGGGGDDAAPSGLLRAGGAADRADTGAADVRRLPAAGLGDGRVN